MTDKVRHWFERQFFEGNFIVNFRVVNYGLISMVRVWDETIRKSHWVWCGGIKFFLFFSWRCFRVFFRFPTRLVLLEAWASSSLVCVWSRSLWLCGSLVLLRAVLLFRLHPCWFVFFFWSWSRPAYFLSVFSGHYERSGSDPSAGFSRLYPCVLGQCRVRSCRYVCYPNRFRSQASFQILREPPVHEGEVEGEGEGHPSSSSNPRLHIAGY